VIGLSLVGPEEYCGHHLNGGSMENHRRHLPSGSAIASVAVDRIGLVTRPMLLDGPTYAPVKSRAQALGRQEDPSTSCSHIRVELLGAEHLRQRINFTTGWMLANG